MDHPLPNTKLPLPRPGSGVAVANVPKPGVAPPRPASGAIPAMGSRRLIKAQSDPPPSDRTQAYAQDELPRLLSEADRRAMSEHAATTLRRTGGHSPTVDPSELAELQTARVELVSLPHAVLRKDTIPDTDELTTAYIRPSSKVPTLNQLAEESFIGIHAEDDAPLVSTSMVVDDSVLQSTHDVGSSGVESANLVEVQSERTGPAVLRKNSLRPGFTQRRELGPRLRWGIGAVGCVSVILTVLAFSRWRAYPTTHEFIASLPKVTRGVAEAAFGRSAAKAPQVVVPEARFIELSIAVDPPQAQLFLDGRVASNPLRVSYPSDNLMHELRAEAPGYRQRTQLVKFDRNLSMYFGLSSAATAATDAAK